MRNISDNPVEHRIEKGFMVIGPNTSDGDTHCWHTDTEALAESMAKTFAQSTLSSYDIIKYEFIGIVRPALFPIEFIKKTSQ